jgi:hypothetical protein
MSGDVVDYVVDGGYFENDGLATARDIAVALKRAKLKPVIIRVTNEPVRALAPGTGLKRPQPPLERDGGFLPTLIAPLAGLYNTRAGHGAEAARAVVELSPNDNYSYIEIGVYDQLPDTAIDRRTCAAYNTQYNYPAVVRELSMSWWLSQPVQEFLDAQLCHPKNRDGLKLIKALLSETPSRAPAPGQIHSTKGGQELVRSVEAGPLGSESKAAPELTPRHRP